MKKLCLVMACCLVAGCTGGNEQDYFEGVVHINVEVDAQDARISADLLNWWFGSTLTWTLKDGDYRIDFDNADRQSVWYLANGNREYHLRSCASYIMWTRADEEIAEIVSVTKTGETREIAGYTANALEVRTRDDDGYESLTRYWYAPELKVDPAWFSANRALGWDQVYQEIDSLIIGSEEESDFVSVRRFATRIDVRSVADSTLELPDMDTRYAPLDVLMGTPPCPMPE